MHCPFPNENKMCLLKVGLYSSGSVYNKGYGPVLETKAPATPTLPNVASLVNAKTVKIN